MTKKTQKTIEKKAPFETLKKECIKRSHITEQYKKKVKYTLKRILDKVLLIPIVHVILFVVSFPSKVKKIIGSVILGLSIKDHSSEWIAKLKEKIREEYPKDSVLGLIGKRVYTEDGAYLGEVESILLGRNKINCLNIKLSKTLNIHTEGIALKYRHVKGSGDILLCNISLHQLNKQFETKKEENGGSDKQNLEGDNQND